METSKMRTYLGFCIRARKIVFGSEMISRQKKGVYLLLADGGIGKSSFKPVVAASERFGCPIVMTDAEALGELLSRPAVKAVAITDKNLASAILSVVGSDSQFKLYSGGTN